MCARALFILSERLARATEWNSPAARKSRLRIVLNLIYLPSGVRIPRFSVNVEILYGAPYPRDWRLNGSAPVCWIGRRSRNFIGVTAEILRTPRETSRRILKTPSRAFVYQINQFVFGNEFLRKFSQRETMDTNAVWTPFLSFSATRLSSSCYDLSLCVTPSMTISRKCVSSKENRARVDVDMRNKRDGDKGHERIVRQRPENWWKRARMRHARCVYSVRRLLPAAIRELGEDSF